MDTGQDIVGHGQARGSYLIPLCGDKSLEKYITSHVYTYRLDPFKIG